MKTLLCLYIFLMLVFGFAGFIQTDCHHTFDNYRKQVRFYERLMYHGLQYDVAVIKDGYFMRDGKRCKF